MCIRDSDIVAHSVPLDGAAPVSLFKTGAHNGAVGVFQASRRVFNVGSAAKHHRHIERFFKIQHHPLIQFLITVEHLNGVGADRPRILCLA